MLPIGNVNMTPVPIILLADHGPVLTALHGIKRECRACLRVCLLGLAFAELRGHGCPSLAGLLQLGTKARELEALRRAKRAGDDGAEQGALTRDDAPMLIVAKSSLTTTLRRVTKFSTPPQG